MTDEPPISPPPEKPIFGRKPPSTSIGMLIFGFGTAAGFLLAFSGLGVIEETTGVILLVFLTALMFIAAFGLLLFLFRKPLWRRLFGLAEAELEHMSTPLVEVARSAVDRDPVSATTAARDLVHMALARYAWIATRRWIIGSLTALIAAMAALAGTALLFRQNELLKAQNTRIDTQIAQIEEQIALDGYNVQLAEAARNAQLVVEITAIAAELGKVVDRVTPHTGPRTAESATPVIDPLQDLDLGLIMRISSASQATKPYRFLQTGVSAHDQAALMRDAIERREDLPKTIDALGQNMRWKDREEGIGLVDRPASPERGQLLRALVQSGVRDLEVPSFYGMDLSYAYAQGIQLPLVSFQVGQMSYADLSFATITEGDFGGAFLFSARFRQSYLRGVSFASVAGADIKPPFGTDIDFYNTALTGADFSGALIRDVDFTGVFALAGQFDGAALLNTRFDHAGLSATTFRGAALLDVSFKGTDLRSVDFDGAVVAGADFLDRTQQSAAPGSFRADRFELEQTDITGALEVDPLYQGVDPEEILRIVGNRGLYRVKRVKPFEE